MTLVVADDHVTVRAGIRALLLADAQLGVTAIEEAASLEQVARTLLVGVPDVLVLDLQLSDGNALEGLADLRRRFPSLKVLVHTLHREGLLVARAMAFGARGFINKESPETALPQAVGAVHRGEVYLDKISLSALADGLTQLDAGALKSQGGLPGLTYREREVYNHLAAGENIKTIAGVLKISTKTVDNHKASILSKLGLSNTFELIRSAQETPLPR